MQRDRFGGQHAADRPPEDYQGMGNNIVQKVEVTVRPR